MIVVLDVYDESVFDYRPRHIVIGAGTQFYPMDYNDIDKGTIVNNYGSIIQVKEPLDQVAIKMNRVYKEAYNLFVIEVQGFITQTKKQPRKTRTKKI